MRMTATATMTATAKNREFEITSREPAGKFLAEALISKGFEPNLYKGISRPVGRQRRTYIGMFYRRANGSFVSLGN